MIVLIDIDNTLIDFNKCAAYTIQNIFQKYNLPYSENTAKTFLNENVKIWKKLENGEITKTYLRENRWNIILNKLSLQGDGKVFEELFEEGIKNTAFEVDGANDFLEYLHKKHSLCIISNGFRKVQENRLKISGFDKYFKSLFFSEDIGFQKPAKEFFDYCFKELDFPEKNDVILIGDSISADIKGGKNYKIKTVWFNKNNEIAPPEVKPDFEIKYLKEIKDIL